jgi:diguanylate cyclase (GGDEF)-like protein/PAS domain S-box-containing protein
MDYYYTPYILPLAFTTVLNLGLSLYLWPKRHSPGASQLIAILLAVSGWTGGYILELLGQDLATKQFWAQVQYFGIVTLPLAWIHFSMAFPHPIRLAKHPPGWLRLLLMVIPVLTLVMVWSPGLDHWIWRASHLDDNGFFLVVHHTYGPGFWAFTLQTYILFFLGSLRLLMVGLSAHNLVRNQVVLILLAVLAPLVGNAIYLLDLSPLVGLDLSPFGFAISGLALFWAILGQKMMDLIPIARNAVLENMMSAVLVVDEAGRIVDLNPAAADLLEAAPDELLRRPFDLALVNWPELARFLEEKPQAKQQRVIHKHQHGARRWFDLRVSPIWDPKTGQSGRVILLLDTTAQNQAGEELLVLRQAVEASGEVIFMTDTSGLITYINPEFTRLYGYSPEEVVGISTPRILKSVNMSPEAYESYWGALFDGQVVKQQFINKTRDGRFLTIESAANPILGTSGEIVGFMAIQYDITEESHRKKIIQRHLAELRILHAVSLAGVAFDSEDALIEYATSIIGEALFPANFGVLLVDLTKRALRFHPSYQGISGDTRELTIRLGEGITGTVAVTQQSCRIEDVLKEPGYISSGEGMRSELCVPMIVSNETIGVLNAESHQVGAFTLEDERLLGTFAGQLATAIAKVRLLEAERKQSSRQAALFELSASLANTMEEELIGRNLVRALKTTLGYGHVGLFLLDDASGDRVLVASQGWPDARKGWHIPPGMGLSDQVIKTGRLRYTPDVRVSTEHIPGVRGGLSEVDVPLRAGGNILGILIVERECVDGFDDGDLNVLTAAANQAAIAIERARLFRQVQRLAITDELTSIHNRRHFFNLAEAEFARSRRFGRPLAVIMMDLDHFKAMNDTHGHVVGDSILRNLAQRCQAHIRQIDIFARYGGEEFVLLLPEADLKAACQTAERLRRLVVQEPILTDSDSYPVTISMGVAASRDDTTTLLALIDQADKALLQAKMNGRDQVMRYLPDGQVVRCQYGEFV